MDREAVVQLNKDIALHAKRKELDEAMALFKQALDAKSENSHTYSNALNANIRCGNLSGAEEVLEIMKKRGRKRDVIICTTLLKGYCSAGRINKAQAFFDDMVQRAPTVTPNLRTINTLLRGCVQTGDVAIAESLVARAQKDFKIALDVSSWEYLVTLLCQSLKLDKVLPIVGRLKDDAACASGMAGMYVNMARTAAVLGDWKVCRKALTGAAASLDSVASTDANEDQNDREDDEAAVNATATATAGTKGDKGTGGKRGSSSAETDARRQESLEVYREHLKSELGAELKVIEAFMTARKDSKVSAFEYVFPFFLRIFPLFPPEQLADGTAPASATTAAPAQTAPSGRPGKKDGGSSNSNSLLKKELVKPIMRAVEDNFGLDVLSRRVTGRSCDDLCGYSLDPSKAPEALAAAAAKAAEAKAAAKAKKLKRDKKRGKAVGGEPAASTASAPAASAVTPDSVPAPVPAAEREKPVLTPLEAQIASFRAHSARVFDSSCKFVFKNVFSTPATTTITSAPASAAAASGSRDLKVEICSGAGEWVVAQAKQDPAADWVAVELRHDRAYQTLTKAVFADVRNLAVLCGDAMHILPSHFPSDCVSRLFVNHPEPPQQTGSRGDSQGRHLLEQAFFVEACRILKPGGVLTIVTDNLWYGRLLLRLVAGLPSSAYSAVLTGDGKTTYALQTVPAPSSSARGAEGELESAWEVKESEGAEVLYVGKPGAAAGHVAEASSYFDRLWKRDNLVERYFLVLRKGTGGHGHSAAVTPAAFHKKRPSASLEVNVLPKGAEPAKNSRIKFE